MALDQTPVAGLSLVIGQEHPELQCCHVDLGAETDDTASLAEELAAPSGETRVAWREEVGVLTDVGVLAERRRRAAQWQPAELDGEQRHPLVGLPAEVVGRVHPGRVERPFPLGVTPAATANQNRVTCF